MTAVAMIAAASGDAATTTRFVSLDVPAWAWVALLALIITPVSYTHLTLPTIYSV